MSQILQYFEGPPFKSPPNKFLKNDFLNVQISNVGQILKYSKDTLYNTTLTISGKTLMTNRSLILSTAELSKQ